MQSGYEPHSPSLELPLQTPTSPGYTPVSYGGWINPRVVTPAVSSIPPIVPPLKINVPNDFKPPSINAEELLSQQRSLLRAQIHALKSDVDRMPDDQYKKRALIQLADMKRQLNSVEMHPAHVHSEYEYDVQRARTPATAATYTPHTTATPHRVLDTPLPSSSHWVAAQPVPPRATPATHTRAAVGLTMPGGVPPSTPVPWHALPRVPAPVQHAEMPTPQETVVAGTRILHAPHAQPHARATVSTRESAAALAMIPDAVGHSTHTPAGVRAPAAPAPPHPNASSLDAHAFAGHGYSASGRLVMDPAALRAVEAAADELAQAHARGHGHAHPPAAGEPGLLHHAGADHPSPVAPHPVPALPLQRVARRPPPHAGPYAGLSVPFATQSSARAPSPARAPTRVLIRRPASGAKAARSTTRVAPGAKAAPDVTATNVTTATFAAAPAPVAPPAAPLAARRTQTARVAPQRTQTPQPRQSVAAGGVPRARTASTARVSTATLGLRTAPTPVPATEHATPLHQFTAAVLQRAQEQVGPAAPLQPHASLPPASPAAVAVARASSPSTPAHPYRGPVAGQYQPQQQPQPQPLAQPAQRSVGHMLRPTHAHPAPQAWVAIAAPGAGVPATAAPPPGAPSPVSVDYDVSGRRLYQPSFTYPAHAPTPAPARTLPLATAPALSRLPTVPAASQSSRVQHAHSHALPTARSQVVHDVESARAVPTPATGPQQQQQGLIVGAAGVGGEWGVAPPTQAVYVDANVRECGATHGTALLTPHQHPHAHTAVHAPARHSAAHAAATPVVTVHADAEDAVAVLSRAEYMRAQAPRRDRNESSLVPHPAGKGLVGNYNHSTPADVLYDHVMQNMGHGPDAEHACLPATHIAPYGHRLRVHGAAQPCADAVAPVHACEGGISHGLGVHAGTSASDYGSVYGGRYSVEAVEMARHRDTHAATALGNAEAMFACEVEDRSTHGLNAHQTPAALARRVLAQLRSHAPDTRFEYLEKHAPSDVGDRRDLQMRPVRHHVKEEYMHPHAPHNVEGPYLAVDRFGKKSYVGAPVGTGDEHSAHLEKGRNKYGKKKVLAQARGEAGYESGVQPEIKSHRNNPHFKIYNRLQG